MVINNVLLVSFIKFIENFNIYDPLKICDVTVIDRNRKTIS